MAFTDFGVETLSDLIKIYKADPGCSSVPASRNRSPAAYAGWVRDSERAAKTVKGGVGKR